MGGLGGIFTFLFFVFLAFVGFVIYLVFKHVQFVIQAVDLYKDMVVRLDKIVELLAASSPEAAAVLKADAVATPRPDPSAMGKCPSCETVIPLISRSCPNCTASFAGSIKVKQL